MISLGAYDPAAALIVFRDLDPCDLMEAQVMRGSAAHFAKLMAEWDAVQASAPLSLILKQGGIPFGVLLVGNTGQAGVGQAALLARNHRRFRRGLWAAGRAIAQDMPAWCDDRGVHRIEARAWSGHPRAGVFLRLCGFRLEVAMPGFGATGAETFHQYAWTA
jgi:hypothetical protein